MDFQNLDDAFEWQTQVDHTQRKTMGMEEITPRNHDFAAEKQTQKKFTGAALEPSDIYGLMATNVLGAIGNIDGVTEGG